MAKTAVFIFALFLFAGAGRSSAQSLQNTAWKFYVEDLHDTLTMHIGVDTACSTSSTGDVIVRSHFAVVKDTVKIDDIDAFEVNEAFASIPMAWLKAIGADPAKLNVHGGAIALGHPLGASGAKLMTTLLHGLRTHGKRYGLQTMCEGGGIANVTIVERL